MKKSTEGTAAHYEIMVMMMCVATGAGKESKKEVDRVPDQKGAEL